MANIIHGGMIHHKPVKGKTQNISVKVNADKGTHPLKYLLKKRNVCIHFTEWSMSKWSMSGFGTYRHCRCVWGYCQKRITKTSVELVCSEWQYQLPLKSLAFSYIQSASPFLPRHSSMYPRLFMVAAAFSRWNLFSGSRSISDAYVFKALS